MSAETQTAIERITDVLIEHRDIVCVTGDPDAVAHDILDHALSVEEVARVLGEHRIECTGLEGVTCRGCRERGWMPRYAFEKHQAAELRTALLGADS